MASHVFLSPEWIAAARALRAEYADSTPAPPIKTRVNIVITDLPDNADEPMTNEPMKGHIDTTSGQAVIDEGHVDEPELTMTLDYETARAAFVTRDPEALMAAFFGGKILVEGDATVLMALQGMPIENEDQLKEMYTKLEAMTI